MRIAQVIPLGTHDYSGVRFAIESLATELVKRQHEVEVWQLVKRSGLTPGDEPTDLGFPKTRIVIKGSFPVDTLLRSEIRRRSPDVIHVHNVFNPTNNLIARYSKNPYVVSPHGGYASAVMARKPIQKWIFKSLFEIPMLAGSAFVSALTEAEVEDLRAMGYRGAVEIVPNGVVELDSDTDPTSFRRGLGLSVDDHLAIYVGRLDPYYKRLDALIRGVASSRSWNLVCVGPDWRGQRARLDRLVSTLNASPRIHFRGPYRGSQLGDALRAADLFVLLSRSEGLPLALLQALAQGVPAIVSPEVERVLPVSHRGAGWVVEPQNLGSLLDSLHGCPSARWTEYVEAAESLANGYRWEGVVDRYESALRKFLHYT